MIATIPADGVRLACSLTRRLASGEAKTKSGAQLTAEDIDALAKEAERGYDLRRARRVRVGRPNLRKKGASPRIQGRIDPELDKALRRRARAERRSVSDLARTALRSYVDGS